MQILSPISNLNSQVADKLLAAAREHQEKPKDAVKLLEAEHDDASDLFDKFFKAAEAAEKQALAAEIYLTLSVHMRIEEDIFYPALQQALATRERAKNKDELIVPEARLEHASLKKLISEVEVSRDEVDFEAHVQVMSEYTKHHVKEEETMMFPRAKDCDLDLDALGQQLLGRKLEILEQMADSSDSARLPSSLFERQPSGAGFGFADRR